MSERVWFTSDLHFGHARIIEYSRRPFASAPEMREELVRRWNDRVRPGDRVYILGDFALCRPDDALAIAQRLMGQKYLVAGNHDEANRAAYERSEAFVWVRDLASIKVGEQSIEMCHYPMLTWRGSHRGSWMLHGHCHGSLKEDLDACRYDVGVDVFGHGYAPVSFEQIAQVMRGRGFEPKDHHVRGGR